MNVSDDLESVHSFDSSVDLNSLIGTDSTVSIQIMEVPRINRQLQEEQIFTFGERTPVKEQNQKQISFPQPEMFVGFKNAWGGKQVQINESKLKKAKMFFDDDDQLEETDYFSVPQPWNKPNKIQFSEESLNETDLYTMPCFKTVGTGHEVKVSKQLQSKAKLFLNEFSSYKKPTRLKKDANVMDESLVKTVNNQKEPTSKAMFQKPESKQLLKIANKGKTESGQLVRQSFNWQQYEKEYRQQISKEKSHVKTPMNTSKKTRRQNVRFSTKEYKMLKLYSLELSPQQEKKASLILSQKNQDPNSENFQHVKEQCSIFKCVLCSINYNNSNFNREELYNILTKEFSKKWISYEQFEPLYLQTRFKLLKYQCFWPQVANKRCNPSNLIVQINKKMLKVAMQGTCSYLKYCIEKEQFGRKINLVVRNKQVNRKMDIIFLLLSDGWFSVWAAIESQNFLYSYLADDSKVRVGTKLCLCLWNLHPFSNILNYCNDRKSTNICIEFFYNGSIILKPNAKLGHTNEQFYRPLNKCRQRGGLIPVVQGYVVRIFTVRQNNKKKGSFSHQYIEILTPEGFTQLVQFVLGEESSLTEYFRLYRCYNLYKLKIENGMLVFGMNCSGLMEVSRQKIVQKDRIYPQPVLKLLKNRLLNLLNINSLKEDSLYDVRCEKGKLSVKDISEMTVQIQGETKQQTESMIYHQYYLAYCSGDKITLRKSQYSSQSRRLPAIYQLIL